MKTRFLIIALKLNLSLKLINFSFVSKRFYFVHNEARSYKKWKDHFRAYFQLGNESKVYEPDLHEKLILKIISFTTHS